MNTHLTWMDLLSQEKKKYFIKILKFLKQERMTKIIYPSNKNIFKAFVLTKLHDIKVVILGQDPYFSKDQAHGLAFSVPKTCTIPPSLKNIHKELNSDFKKKYIFSHGSLEKWAMQGVFLLNTILTVEAGRPRSHYHIGWNIFIDKVIHTIVNHQENIIFLLWGQEAQKKCCLITDKNHYILKSSHPSPLSAFRSFFGCKHFSQTNNILLHIKKDPINWFLI